MEDAANGRMINKRLTLGFDASLAYGAARSPSFFPYLFGEESLFNDRFSGDGRYLYEQRPTGSGKGKLWGRGLKGLGDAALSAYPEPNSTAPVARTNLGPRRSVSEPE